MKGTRYTTSRYKMKVQGALIAIFKKAGMIMCNKVKSITISVLCSMTSFLQAVKGI